MDNTWKEKNFEEKMTPHINEIYNDLFKNKISKIIRNTNGNQDKELLFMDKYLGIDTQIIFKDGSKITLQEKTRKYYYFQKYNDFTFEYYNDPKLKEQGEWFKLAAQLYFYGFSNEKETGYEKFYILDICKLRRFLTYRIGLKNLEKNYLHQNIGSAKANFFHIPFDLLRKNKNIIEFENNKPEIIDNSIPAIPLDFLKKKRSRKDVNNQQNLFHNQMLLFGGV
jgi:hypothetical protein